MSGGRDDGTGSRPRRLPRPERPCRSRRAAVLDRALRRRLVRHLACRPAGTQPLREARPAQAEGQGRLAGAAGPQPLRMALVRDRAPLDFRRRPRAPGLRSRAAAPGHGLPAARGPSPVEGRDAGRPRGRALRRRGGRAPGPHPCLERRRAGFGRGFRLGRGLLRPAHRRLPAGRRPPPA